ncbi:MAG: hypothetical protein WBA57_18330 [Elainellaceae cyanobacterium]
MFFIKLCQCRAIAIYAACFSDTNYRWCKGLRQFGQARLCVAIASLGIVPSESGFDRVK